MSNEDLCIDVPFPRRKLRKVAGTYVISIPVKIVRKYHLKDGKYYGGVLKVRVKWKKPKQNDNQDWSIDTKKKSHMKKLKENKTWDIDI